jgi:hypothetical protein
MYYLKNYTDEDKNLNKNVDAYNADMQAQKQIQLQAYQNRRNFEQLSEINSNQWSPEEYSDNNPLNGVKIIGDDIYRREYKPSRGYDNLLEDVPVEVGSLINQFKGEKLLFNMYA